MTKLVVLFNWHFFLIAALACLAGLAGMYLIDIGWIRVMLGLGIGAAVYFMVASVVASYLVYDHSDLYKMNWWPQRVMPNAATDAVLVHAGFDPASRKLVQKYPDVNWQILDFFSTETTTETSIRTARKLFPPMENESQISPEHWPLADQSQDVVFAISAAHEIRDDQQRAAFFGEARRVLRSGGRLVVIEQLRDVTNLLAFGAAFLHFLSYRTWLRSFEASGFDAPAEFRLSPWMKVFVLSAPGG